MPPLLPLMTPPWLCAPLTLSLLFPPSLFPDQTWYLLVELKGISATLGFLSLIFLTEPQDSSMHLSRADSEASPAVSRCQERSQCPGVARGGWRTGRPPQGMGEAGHQHRAQGTGCGDGPDPLP